MNAILRTVELACANVMATASLAGGLDANIYVGLDSDIKEAPAVICSAESATQDFQDGPYHVRVEISVKENSTITSPTSSLAYNVFTALETTSSVQNLTNSVPNFIVFDVFSAEPRNSEAGDAWHQTVSYDIVCMLT